MSRRIAHFFGPQAGMKETAKKARTCDVYHADDGTDYVLDNEGRWFAVSSIPAPKEEPEVSETPVAPSPETPEPLPTEEPAPKKRTSKKKEK